jgi:hypothetical protein
LGVRAALTARTSSCFSATGLTYVKLRFYPVIASQGVSKRVLLALLCITLAIGAPLAGAFAAEQPCASAGASPCDCDGSAASACTLACASLLSALAPASLTPDFIAVRDQAVGNAPGCFASIAGPPGLQPPR